ncbi:MAG TPA: hypothetical protein VIT00_01655 [Terrimicrobiaceae bacterium]
MKHIRSRKHGRIVAYTAASKRAASAPQCSAIRASSSSWRQNDRADLDDMARDISVTELTKRAIRSCPLPDQQQAKSRLHLPALHAQNPVCGAAHNVASAEMPYISDSSGAQLDDRAENSCYAGEFIEDIPAS